MERTKYLTMKRLKGICKRLDDPCRPWGNKKHEMIDVIVIALLGIICGCETWQDIRDYGTVKRKWLKFFLKLPDGIPSEATFRRLIGMIRAESLERIYREWVRPYVGGCYGKQVCIDGKHEWASLRTFFMIERIGKTRDGTTIEQAFYISSLETDAKDFLRYARGHWSVENQLHWMLDVAFREDACLIHRANAPQNLALLRKMALTLIKQDTTYNASVRRKQKMAGWDNDYALTIIS